MDIKEVIWILRNFRLSRRWRFQPRSSR